MSEKVKNKLLISSLHTSVIPWYVWSPTMWQTLVLMRSLIVNKIVVISASWCYRPEECVGYTSCGQTLTSQSSEAWDLYSPGFFFFLKKNVFGLLDILHPQHIIKTRVLEYFHKHYKI